MRRHSLSRQLLDTDQHTLPSIVDDQNSEVVNFRKQFLQAMAEMQRWKVTEVRLCKSHVQDISE